MDTGSDTGSLEEVLQEILAFLQDREGESLKGLKLEASALPGAEEASPLPSPGGTCAECEAGTCEKHAPAGE